MSYLTDICCICLDKKPLLSSYTIKNGHDYSYYEKMFMLIPQMCFSRITSDSKICNDCCRTIDSTISFRKMCLMNKDVLLEFMEVLKTSEDEKTSSDLIEFKKIRFKEEEINGVDEIEKDDDNNNAADEVKTETDENKPELNASDMLTLKKLNNMLRQKKRRKLQQRYEQKRRRRIKRRQFVEESINRMAGNAVETAEGEPPTDTISNVIESVITSVCDSEANKKELSHQEKMIRKYKNRKFECQFCFQVIRYRPRFVEHYNIVHGGRRPFVCEICNKGFIENYLLTNHVKNVHCKE